MDAKRCSKGVNVLSRVIPLSELRDVNLFKYGKLYRYRVA